MQFLQQGHRPQPQALVVAPSYSEWGQPRRELPQGPDQGVGRRPLEVVNKAIEGLVVWVP